MHPPILIEKLLTTSGFCYSCHIFLQIFVPMYPYKVLSTAASLFALQFDADVLQ